MRSNSGNRKLVPTSRNNIEHAAQLLNVSIRFRDIVTGFKFDAHHLGGIHQHGQPSFKLIKLLV